MGACIGVGLLAVLALVVDGLGGFPFVWDAFWLSGVIGGLLGAALAPLTGFTVLRHVAIGRAVAVTTFGTVSGASIGLLITRNPIWAVGGALAGYILSAAWLYRRHKRTQPSSVESAV